MDLLTLGDEILHLFLSKTKKATRSHLSLTLIRKALHNLELVEQLILQRHSLILTSQSLKDQKQEAEQQTSEKDPQATNFILNSLNFNPIETT